MVFPPAMLTDTHAHLDFPELTGELPAVLARAEAAGVRRIVTIGTSLEGSRQAVALAHAHPAVFAAIGVHPNEATEAPDDVAGPLRELAQHPKVVAIGETGLDHHRLPDDPSANPIRARQFAVFTQQLELAAELDLPVVIHERNAWTSTLVALRPFNGRVRAVFHCFGKGLPEAEEVLALGHSVSFTGIVTFKNAPFAQQSAAGVPTDRLMVETDCPFLAPAPFRGKRCEPAHVRLTAEHIAALRGAAPEEFAAQTERNAEAFFRFDRWR